MNAFQNKEQPKHEWQGKKILLLGSAALKIGEAGEFDYSGSQAIKALRDEGCFTILINPNIATNQTSENLANRVYFLPISPDCIEKVIEKEKPAAILLSFGGQTALNCGIKLFEKGVFEKHQVQVLGTPVSTILATEDRSLFVKKLKEMGVPCPVSFAVYDLPSALVAAEKIGYPIMMRSAFALGGLGSGIMHSPKNLKEKASEAFRHVEQILIEECLYGWKEIEYEVVRDAYDNCITVCNMENFDPLGIHTGESIVVAPSQTLNNEEYQKLRSTAIKTIRNLGIVGECNIQYALNPKNSEFRVIEVNARLSRSSALASKATGYPLAYVAAKIALGLRLTEIPNPITKTTFSFFEPALDYVVIKIPKWDLKKFPMVKKEISSSMKSVGEVMAIGRKFEEALQKGIRMLDVGAFGLVGNEDHIFPQKEKAEIYNLLKNPTEDRLFVIAQALKIGLSVSEIQECTAIDPWFLNRLVQIVFFSEELKQFVGKTVEEKILKKAKELGFSDQQIANLLHLKEEEIRKQRLAFSLHPCLKNIDTLAGEFEAHTNYLYLTYNASENDAIQPLSLKNLPQAPKEKILVLGSGAYRIGSSVEFDWCTVNTVQYLKELGYETLLLNCNPETVSTDYDEVDRLYFEEIHLETILEILRIENMAGVIVSMGGQKANNLALQLTKEKVKIFGTQSEDIDRAEDRQKFSEILDLCQIQQPKWRKISNPQSLAEFVQHVGFPILIRPSYVLSGTAMGVASNQEELGRFLEKAKKVSSDSPIVVSQFIENAKEIELDAVSFEGQMTLFAISEHVENAGVHSGDATLVYPAQRVFVETMRRILNIGQILAQKLNICGPFNVQFMAKNKDLMVIECNLRASRSFPFVSKVSKVNFIQEATRAALHLSSQKKMSIFPNFDYVGVKAAQFSFARLDGADPTLGVEMSSTGEVACLGDDFEEALLKALLSVGYTLPIQRVLFSLGPEWNKLDFLPIAKRMVAKGIEIYATTGTHQFFLHHDLKTTPLFWPEQTEIFSTEPFNHPPVQDVMQAISLVDFDLVVNIPKNYSKEELDQDYLLRRKTVDCNLPLITNLHLAKRFLNAYLNQGSSFLKIKAWDEYT